MTRRTVAGSSWRVAVTVLAVLTVVVHAGDTRASADAAGGTLRTTRQIVSFSGSLERSAATSADVPECDATPCDQFDLHVELPPGTWNQRRGHVEVSIRWTGFGDNLRLYVHRGGELVATGDGIVATKQSIALSGATNGLYRINVAFDPDSVAMSSPTRAWPRSSTRRTLDRRDPSSPTSR